MTQTLTIVGGGIGGLTTAIAAAEQHVKVELFEASERLGGQAWTLDGPFRANWGPHVIYSDGPWWTWLKERNLTCEAARFPAVPKLKVRYHHTTRRFPPVALIRSLIKLRRATAPTDTTFIQWAATIVGDEHAQALANFTGVVTYDSDPGRLCAKFVHERLVRATKPIPAVRYPTGGWGALSAALGRHAQELGVQITTGHRITEIPSGPTVLAIPMAEATKLTGDTALRPSGTTTALLDVVLVGKRPPIIVSDFDEPGWAETFSTIDPTLTPAHHHLVQAQKGMRAGETLDEAVSRIESLFDASIPTWRTQEVWRRRAKVSQATGALDVPGTTWRDRPIIDRGNDLYLVNDMVAAPGLLAEVSFNAALNAVALLTARTSATTVS